MRNPFDPIANKTVIKSLTEKANIYEQGSWLTMNKPSEFVTIDGDQVIARNLCYDYIQGVDFRDADLRGVYLSNTTFAYVSFEGADLTGAVLNDTTFICCYNLHKAKGLDKVVFDRLPILDIRTLELNVQQLPDAFLEGCGYSPAQIAVLRMMHSAK